MTQMGLLCMPRPSYFNKHGWTHSVEPPFNKTTRAVAAGLHG